MMTSMRKCTVLLLLALLRTLPTEVHAQASSTEINDVQLNVMNDMDEPINCFWKGVNGESHLIMSMERHTSSSVNTFMGHVFEFRVAFGGASQSMQGSLLGRYTVQSDADVVVSRVAAANGMEAEDKVPADEAKTSEDDIPDWEQVVTSAESDPHANTKAIRISQEVLSLAKPGVPRASVRSLAQGVKFRSFLSYDVRIFWDNKKGLGNPQGVLYPDEDSTTNSYTGHTFIFRKLHTDEEVTRVTIKKGQVLYLIKDGSEVADKRKLRETMEQLSFMKAYEEKAGRPWVASYPKAPLEMHMLPAETVGENKTVVSEYGLFHCIPRNEKLPWDPSVHTDCAPENDLELTVTTISVEPRVFQVEGFFSAEEAEHIRSIAGPRLKRSSVGNSKKGRGGYVASTRTSSTAWVARSDSPVVDRLHRRAADVLGIPQERIWSNGTGIAEHLQVVHYTNMQEYSPHHDWDGTSPVTRLITLLLYLNDQANEGAGGETEFPKAWNPSGRDGVKVAPKVGRAVIFYSQLPDGNCDDYSLHAALPVKEGEKWLANFWIHNDARKYELCRTLTLNVASAGTKEWMRTICKRPSTKIVMYLLSNTPNNVRMSRTNKKPARISPMSVASILEPYICYCEHTSTDVFFLGT